MSDDAEHIWRRARNSRLSAIRAETRATWLHDITREAIVTNWALGLEALPAFVIEDPSLLQLFAEGRARSALDIQDHVSASLGRRAAQHRNSSNTMLNTVKNLLDQEGSNDYDRAVEKIEEFGGREKATVTQQLLKKTEFLTKNQPSHEQLATARMLIDKQVGGDNTPPPNDTVSKGIAPSVKDPNVAQNGKGPKPQPNNSLPQKGQRSNQYNPNNARRPRGQSRPNESRSSRIDRLLDYILDPADFPALDTARQAQNPKGKGKRPQSKGLAPQGNNKRSRSSSPKASTSRNQDFWRPPGIPGPIGPGQLRGLANGPIQPKERPSKPTTPKPKCSSHHGPTSDHQRCPKGNSGPFSSSAKLDPCVHIPAVTTDSVSTRKKHSDCHIDIEHSRNVNNQNNNLDLLSVFRNKICTPVIDEPVSVINLSDYRLSRDELSLLDRGLNFCPTPGEPHLGDLRRDLDCFHRRLKIKAFFDPKNVNLISHPQGSDSKCDESTDDEDDPIPSIDSPITVAIKKSKVIRNERLWQPGIVPTPLKAYILTNENDLNKTFVKSPHSTNLSRAEKTALKTLSNNQDIVKKADKGSSIVIQNRIDYIKEGERQLSDPKFL